MTYPLVILGGGLSGLAAGIRFARFGQKVLILEKHRLAGGLNSYYYRQGHLLETGLHAMTNYAPPAKKSAPLNKLFRQLKLKRKEFTTREQFFSEIKFPQKSIFFSNDFTLLQNEIAEKFPTEIAGFNRLLAVIKEYDPFLSGTWLSTRQQLGLYLYDELLIDMLLCPLMLYGNSEEYDMDFGQFVIMFRSVYLEGFFRPAGTIKDLLDQLLDHYLSLGGEIRFSSEVIALTKEMKTINTVQLSSGEEIKCDKVISTIGLPATLKVLPGALNEPGADSFTGRMSFVESIYLLPAECRAELLSDRTIIFYNMAERYRYCRPVEAVNVNSGVICFPENFQEMPVSETLQVRVTHPANYDHWLVANQGVSGFGPRSPSYLQLKKEWQEKSVQEISKIIGNFHENIVYEDTFTPLTIEKYSNKAQGAIYGSPVKIKDALTNYRNLFVAGTDQGYLGIVGSMLSGIVVVNQCIFGDLS